MADTYQDMSGNKKGMRVKTPFEKLRKKAIMYRRVGEDHKNSVASWQQDISELMEPTYSFFQVVLDQDNMRQAHGRSENISDIVSEYSKKYHRNISTFIRSVVKSSIKTAGVTRGIVSKVYVKSIAGDSVCAESATEMLEDISQKDGIEKKLVRMAEESFKYNSAAILNDRYGMKEGSFLFNCSVVSGKDLIFDPIADPSDPQTGRFFGITNLHVTMGDLKSMERTATTMQQREEIRIAIRQASENEKKSIKVCKLFIDLDGETVCVLLGKDSNAILRLVKVKQVSLGGRRLKFPAVFMVDNIDDNNYGAYSPSALHNQMPFIRGIASILVDQITAVNKARTSPQLVHPAMYQQFLSAYLNNLPVIEAARIPNVDNLSGAVYSIPQPDLQKIQYVYSQISESFTRYFPEMSDIDRNKEEGRLKSVYDGNASMLRAITQARSSTLPAKKDLHRLMLSSLIYSNPEKSIQSESFGGLILQKLLKSKLFKNKSGEVSLVAADIRAMSGDAQDFVRKRDLVVQLRSSQTINQRNLDVFLLRHGDKDMIHFSDDDLFALMSRYDYEIVSRAMNDLKLLYLGEDVQYPFPLTSDYLEVMREYTEKTKFAMAKGDKLTKGGMRVFDYMDSAALEHERQRILSGSAFNRQESRAAEAAIGEDQFNLNEASKLLFSNQVSRGENNDQLSQIPASR